MALITCPECGKRISDKSSACIGCGIPMEEIRKIINVPEPSAQLKKLNKGIITKLFGL